MRSRATILLLLIVGWISFLPAEILRRSPYRGAIAANANGKILFEDLADARAFPASVSKLMTALLVLEDLRAGCYSGDTIVRATKAVAQSEPSWIGLKEGDQMTVRDLLYALMVESANDGAIALAVHSAGSLDAFVARMNARAKELGMSKTVYYNPNGLPPNPAKKYPWKQYNETTARDQLKLAQAILRYPEILKFTSVKACDLISTPTGYRISLKEPVIATGEKLVCRLESHNNLMCAAKQMVINDDGSEAVDGLKTGYINDGGSSIVLTGSRKGCRVIVVILGSNGAKVRDEAARHIFMDALGAVSW